MITASVGRQSVGGLKQLLATMNLAPGQANAANSLIPFGKVENLHFARFTILDDQTLDDVRLYGLPRQEYPLYLAFLCDFDGGVAAFLTSLIRIAGPGLRRVFSFCDDFEDGADLLQWLRHHEIPIATSYVNWRGRTVKQVREEANLRQTIEAYLRVNAVENQTPEQIRERLRTFVEAETTAGRLTLTPPAATPWGEKLGNLLHLIGVGFVLLLLLPPVALLLLFRIRPLENADPMFTPRPDPEHVRQLAILEDHEVTNQFSAMGSLKPGLARRCVLSYVLWAIEWTARHLYTKGRLARVRTIHFARWVFLDGRKRILFASNYDGSLESYMDDFINKVGFGLNVVFSNGIGYPTTRWLLADGANDEQNFKYFLRRHQVPTDVWYNAHPSMTAVELERNSRIREGLQAAFLSGEATREWVQLL
ncbi:MAG: hypothetical protein ACRD9L_04435 [Bryobacteraceae bacterium]